MLRGTTKHTCVGKRVQIPAYTDLWMRGARFGKIVRIIERNVSYVQAKDPRAQDIFVVKMDHPQVRKLARVIADDCTFSS